jgi:DNA-binding transcriptional ArsR family regulator
MGVWLLFIVEEKNGKICTLPSKEVTLFEGLRLRVLMALAKKPSYPKELARKMGIDEQMVYYHIHVLEKKGIIKVIGKEVTGGTVAKIYALTNSSFFVKFKDMEESKRVPKAQSEFLQPFIKDGKFDAKIVVGSPDPHGPERARSRDISYAIDLAMFLGTFLTDFDTSCIALDTELHTHDMKGNMILIGGPVTNKITYMVNEKMPVRFDEKHDIVSGKKVYDNDECGIIVKIPNPFDKDKKILVIAGKRYMGTRAAVLTFLKKFSEIKNTNVVEGLDNDRDGIVDDVKIVE